MGVANGTVLYLGTTDGLYRAALSQGDESPAAQLLGLKGQGGIRSAVVVDNKNPQRLYTGTNQGGMFRSDDGGQSWQEINQGIIYKEIWSLVQHPQTGELYAGTGPSAVFKSQDGGDSWQHCEQLQSLPETKDWTFPRPPHISHVKNMTLHPDDPGLVYGAVEEGWLIRSQDGGRTWRNIKDGVEFDNHAVTIMPDNSQIVTCASGTGFYRSEDGGEHFEKANNGLEHPYLMPVVVHPDRPQVLYAAGAAVPPPFWRRPQGADAAFYRSPDQGQSWQRLRGGLPASLTAGPRCTAGDPENPASFYIGMSDGTLWSTNDGGESFQKVLEGLGHITSIRVSHS